MNPTEVHQNGALVYEGAQLVVPGKSLPAASPYAINQDLEIISAKPEQTAVAKTVVTETRKPASEPEKLTETAARTPAPKTIPAAPLETKIQAPIQAPMQTPMQTTIQTTDTDLNLSLGVNYGAAYMNLAQSGAFGKVSGSSVSLNDVSMNAKADFGDWSGSFEFNHYSLAMGTDTANASAKEDKNFDEFAIKGGYRNFILGVRSKMTPLFGTGTGTTLQWADLTTTSVLVGYHLGNESIGPSMRPYRVGLDTEAELPISGGSTSGVEVSNLKGYAFRIRGVAEKTLIQSKILKLSAGLTGLAAYSHYQYNGSWDTMSGAVQGNLLEFQGSAGITVEW